MSFMRAEARDTLWRLREVLAGAGVAALGAWWIAGPGGLLGWIGWVLVAAGLALVVIGAQRARFRVAGQGPGVVQVDEGRIVYFGPLTGGALAVAGIERLTWHPEARPPHWQIAGEDGAALMIPVNAEGAEALFDAFATLPGLKTERMLSVMRRARTHPVVVWERSPTRPALAPLH